MKIAFLGPEGGYAEEVGRQLSPAAALTACAAIAEVFEAVAEGRADRGVVPLESLTEGPVTETLDHLFQHAGRADIVDVILLSLQCSLGSLAGRSQIRKIYGSRPHLGEASEALRREFPGADLVETTSAKAAIEEILREKRRDVAALAPEPLLRRHGLEVLESKIGEGRAHKVKFAVLGRGYHPRTGSDTTSLAIYPHRDRIGLLEDILHIISREYGLNLSSIHSRPDSKGGFRFHIELEGHLEDEAVSGCLQDLEKKLAADDAEVRVFGAYPRRVFNEPRLQAIGIIGGTGMMGGWFSRFFEGAGYRVNISGRRTPLTYQGCVEQSDAVIVNVPIQPTVEVIRSVGRYFRAGQLIVDNTSIKTQPVAAMLEAVPEGVEVLGMHTVFGPAVKELRNQNVIFTHTPRSGELAQEFENIFYKHGARITVTTPEYHDEQMAFHQNLEHFTKIALAEVLRDRFGGPEALASYSSPNSRVSLMTMGRILNMDPQMVSEIQTFNPQGPAMIEKYLEVVNRLGEALVRGDREMLHQSMAEDARALGGEFLSQMMRASQEVEVHLGEWNRAAMRGQGRQSRPERAPRETGTGMDGGAGEGRAKAGKKPGRPEAARGRKRQ